MSTTKKRKRVAKCSNCGTVGHYYKTCPDLKGIPAELSRSTRSTLTVTTTRSSRNSRNSALDASMTLEFSRGKKLQRPVSVGLGTVLAQGVEKAAQQKKRKRGRPRKPRHIRRLEGHVATYERKLVQGEHFPVMNWVKKPGSSTLRVVTEDDGVPELTGTSMVSDKVSMTRQLSEALGLGVAPFE